MLTPDKATQLHHSDVPVSNPNFYINGLKARSTKRFEIPVVLSRKVKDPATKEIIFDKYNGPLFTTMEYVKSETSTSPTYNTLTFLPMNPPPEDLK